MQPLQHIWQLPILVIPHPSSSASTHHSFPPPPPKTKFESNLSQVVAEPGQSMSSLALVGAPRGESGQPGTQR